MDMHIVIRKKLIEALNQFSGEADIDIEFLIEYALGFSYFSPDSKFKEILLGDIPIDEDLTCISLYLSDLSVELCKSLHERYTQCNEDNLSKKIVVSINIACEDYLRYKGNR